MTIKTSFKWAMAAGFLTSSCLCISTEVSAMHRRGHHRPDHHDGACPARGAAGGGGARAASRSPPNVVPTYSAFVNILKGREPGSLEGAARAFLKPDFSYGDEHMYDSGSQVLGQEGQKHLSRKGLTFTQKAAFMRRAMRALILAEHIGGSETHIAFGDDESRRDIVENAFRKALRSDEEIRRVHQKAWEKVSGLFERHVANDRDGFKRSKDFYTYASDYLVREHILSVASAGR